MSTTTSPPPNRASRAYSFTDHSIHKPSVPHPGDRLDEEFDALYGHAQFTRALLDNIFTPAGHIRPHSVGIDHLDPDIRQILFDDIRYDLTEQLDHARAQTAYANAAADRAHQEAGRATQMAIEAAQALSQVNDQADDAIQARADVLHISRTIDDQALETENFANDAEASANRAHNDQELAGAWAEYLEGNEPIPAMFFDHTGITGQHWSSRWWAIKAANAFGSLAELYLGAHPVPPTHTSTGDEIPIGAIYYNTISGQPYIWNGTEWVPFYAPTKAYMLTLAYSATAGQTVFDLTTPDMGMNSYALSVTVPEPLDLYVNGVRLPANASTGNAGDWTVDHATSTVTLSQGTNAGDLVQIDVLAPASSLAPSRVQTQALLDFDINPVTDLPGQIDGTRTTFPLVLASSPHSPVGVSSAQELFVSLDGVVQQPGTDYNVGGGNIIFGEAPLPGAEAWASWYGPGIGSEGPGTGYLPLTGGTLTGKLTLDGSTPTLGADAVSKAYVDTRLVGGPFLPLTGGTMTGALMVTAAGSPVTRSLQVRMGDEINLLDWGASNVGVDCSDLLIAALATGKNVYMPAGIYRWRKQITVGVNGNTPQRLRGDGLSTVVIIEANFDPAATSIIKLNGAESNAPAIQDMHISFAQPINATSRAAFVTLGTPGAGTGLLGVKYPPAVLFGAGCNRFRIQRMRFSNCWDGIHQVSGSDSGGWWIRDIEISAYNIGLKLARTKDFCHLSGWHNWFYNQTVANMNVMRDGQVYCMQLGQGGESEGINITEVNNFCGRILIDNAAGWATFSNVMMDGDNATIEQTTHGWTQISNIYFTCAGAGPSGGKPSIKLDGGRLQITNIHGWAGMQPFVQQTGGTLMIDGGMMQANVKDVPLVDQTGGYFRATMLEIRATTPSAWTVPLFRSTGGVFILNDSYVANPSVGDAGLVGITTDSAMHQVTNISLNGWKFTPPGALGLYQNGSNFYTKQLLAGTAGLGSATAATTAMTLHATGQKTINYYNNNVLHWAEGAFNAGDDWALLRFNDAGVQQQNALSVNRATGVLQLSFGGNVVTYAVNPTDMPAASGWRALGIQGVTGISPALDLINTSDNSTTNILFRRSRGTPTAPTTIASGDTLGNINYMGYDGTSWVSNSALIRINASAAWTTSVHDTQLMFYATTGTTLVNGLILTGAAMIHAVPITTTTAYGNQVKLGTTGAAGRVDFARGSDGGFTGWVGIDGAGLASVALVNGSGSPVVYLDARNAGGTVSLRTNSVERLGVTDTAITSTLAFTAPSHRVGSNQVVGARVTGWAAATGTATRTTFVTGSVTLPQLAERVKALIDDLTTHGLIGT